MPIPGRRFLTGNIFLRLLCFWNYENGGYRPEYYKTKNGYEVDFVISSPQSNIKELIQVSVSLKDDKTKKREIRGLEKAMAEQQQLTSALLITADEEGVITTDSGKITLVPAWFWAIQLDDEQDIFYNQYLEQSNIFAL